jgi:hypothetical protein
MWTMIACVYGLGVGCLLMMAKQGSIDAVWYGSQSRSYVFVTSVLIAVCWPVLVVIIPLMQLFGKRVEHKQP